MIPSRLAKRLLLAAAGAALLALAPARAQQEILNASYDISRELFEDVNRAFVPYWQQKSGAAVVVKQSHAGTSRQARAILEGLDADVVTFNQPPDIQVLAEGRLVSADWATQLPHQASPYYSLTSFLVRKGNPKNIRDWADLARADVAAVFPNPKTSGNGRYTVLAAWAYAKAKYGGDEPAREFVGKILAGVPVFDTGGRGSSTSFIDRGIGDVLVTFEAETYALRDRGAGEFEVITPSISVLADFPVAVVERVARKHGTTALARGYLEFLYTPAAQEILAKNYYRVRDAGVAARHASDLGKVELVTVEQAFGGWDAAQKTFFANNAVVDQLLGQRR